MYAFETPTIPSIFVGAHARAGARASGRRAGACDKGIRAEIHVEHRALCALEQHALTVPDHLVQQMSRIAHQRR